jgi:hypothetical protein
MFSNALKERLIYFLSKENTLNYIDKYDTIVFILQHRFNILHATEEKLIQMRDNNLLNSVTEIEWPYMRELIQFIMPKIVHDFTIALTILSPPLYHDMLIIFDQPITANEYTLSRCLPMKKLIDFIFSKAIMEDLHLVEKDHLIEWYQKEELSTSEYDKDLYLKIGLKKLVIFLDEHICSYSP